MRMPEPDPVTFLIGVALSAVFGTLGLILCIVKDGLDFGCILSFLGLVFLLLTVVIVYLENMGIIPSRRQ